MKTELKSNYLFNKKNSFLEKIWWRIKFLLLESWSKDISAIICSLYPANKRSGEKLAELLHKKKYIKWDKENKLFYYNKLKFFYSGMIPMTDFIDMWLINENYIKINFLTNSSIPLEGPYEFNKVILKNNDYVIDAGANFGLFSIYASYKVGKRGFIYAFEPIKETRKILIKNIRVNNIKNIEVIPYALGKINKKVEFALHGDLGESSGYFINNRDIKTEIVNQTSIDSFILDNNIKKIDFIKADIEGMERDLLIGAKNTIKRFKPKLSICIYHRPDDPIVIEKIIREFVPEYKIYKNATKIFAWIDNN